MKKGCFLVLIALLSTGSAFFAQNTNTPAPFGANANGENLNNDLANMLDGRQYHSAVAFDNRYRGIQGSPFMWDDWSEGILVTLDSQVIKKTLLFKFDAYSNEIWIKDATGNERVLFSNQVRSLELKSATGEAKLLRKFEVPGADDLHRFYEVIYTGKNYTLIREIKKILKKADLEDKGLVTVGKPYDRFEAAPVNYYLREGSRLFASASLKKKVFIENCPADKTAKVEIFCKEKGIKGKLSMADAVMLLQYMDTN